MAVYYGKIGFVETVETSPSVWTEQVKEYPYSGRILSNSKSWATRDQENDDLRINVKLSIIADPYAREHFFAIRYVCWNGAKWKVTSVEPKFPRLLLTLGEVYNGEIE